MSSQVHVENQKLHFELKAKEGEVNKWKEKYEGQKKEMQHQYIELQNLKKDEKARAKEKEQHGKLLYESERDKVHHANEMTAMGNKNAALMKQKSDLEEYLARSEREVKRCGDLAEDARKKKEVAESKIKELEFEVDKLTANKKKSERKEAELREERDFNKDELTAALTKCDDLSEELEALKKKLIAAEEIRTKGEEDLLKLKRRLEEAIQEGRAKQAALSEQLNEQLDNVNRAK